MTIEHIESELKTLEDKSINNHEEHFLEFLLEDYIEGGYDCCIDQTDKGWFISELIERLNDLFFTINDLKLEHDITYNFLRRIIKCKYDLDKIVIKENLDIAYYNDKFEESLIEANSKENLPSIINTDKKTIKAMSSIYHTCKSLNYIDCEESNFIKALTGKTSSKIVWKGAKNKLAVFADVLKEHLSLEYKEKRFKAISEVFIWRTKPQSNTMLADAYDKASLETVESIKNHFKNTI